MVYITAILCRFFAKYLFISGVCKGSAKILISRHISLDVMIMLSVADTLLAVDTQHIRD
jgi:hypothetical protein